MTRTVVKECAAKRVFISPLFLILLVAWTTPASGQSLRGSSKSLDLQNRVAEEHDFTYIDTPERVGYFASQGWLVRVLFIERLSRQYLAACGEQLVITSLTRPTERQPRNASDRSVHPTGMAVDLRYSGNRNCRLWLERVLGDLEQTRDLEATRERYPPHYHIAIFPNQYAGYVEILQRRTVSRSAEISYTVRSGDSLWTIARRHQTTVAELRQANGLHGSMIYAGQILEVPANH